MSFIIERVTVNNFRTHKFFEFEPEPSGVTIIKGANGTGKSSLVNAIAWCLFGIKPPGVGKNSDLRRKDMDIDNEKSFVEVILKTGTGVTYKIQRRIIGKKASTECDVWEIIEDEKNPTNNQLLDHVAGASVSHATDYLKAHLGVTEKGFLASIFVQQKQVDDLITSSPKERSIVIEKMTGITALTEAVTEIKKETNDSKKTVEILANNANSFNTEELEKTLTEYKNKINIVNIEINDITENGKQKKTLLDNIKEQHNHSSTIKNNINNNDNEIKNLNNHIDFILENINDLQKDINKKEKELSLINHLPDDNSENNIKEKYNALSISTNSLKRELDNIDNHIVNTKKTMSGYMRFKTQLESQGIVFTKDNFSENTVSQAITGLKEEYDTTVKNVNSLEKTLTELDEKELNVKFDINTHNQTIKALDNESGECPTCHQKPHNVQELLESIKKIVNDSKKRLENIQKDKKETIKQLEERKNIIFSLEELIQELENTLQHIPILDELKTKMTHTRESLEKETKEFEQVKNLYDNLKKIELLSDSISTDKEKIITHQSQVNKQEETIDKLQEENKKFDNDLNKYPPIKELEKELQSTTHELDNLKTKLFEKKEERSNLQLKIEYTDKDLNRAESSAEEYKKALNKLEKVTAASSVVTNFREKRISEVIPEISFMASELLQRFTSGKFVGVELDSSYKAKVELPNGEKRDTGLLSGGELSAVALALRLAIALISYGESTGTSTMILDEVLVSQDEDRVESIISTMKEVLQGQVILIGHNGDIISTIADNTIELT